MRNALGLIEVTGFSATIVVLDQLDKASSIRLLQVELNDLNGAQIKIEGEAGAVRAALQASVEMGRRIEAPVVTRALNGPHASVWPIAEAKQEFSPLIEQDVIYFPHSDKKESPMADRAPFAIGLIETQGLTAVLEALDTAAKAASVEVIGREKLGGGYVTVILKGDVAAVKAAVDAAKARLTEAGLGKLIAAHVIARPSEAVLSFLPK